MAVNGRSPGVFGGAAAPESDPEEARAATAARTSHGKTARLVLLDDDQEFDDFLLASETAIGRGVTNDVVLPDRSIATRHARIVHDGDGYMLQALPDAATTLNGVSVTPGKPIPLADGDRIGIGNLSLRFESGS